MRKKGLTKTEVSKTLDIPIKRLRRYLSGDAELLCKDGRSYVRKASLLDAHRKVIENMLVKKMPYKNIHYEINAMGIKISYSTLCRYCGTRFGVGQPTLETPPVRHSISRKQIFNHIWFDQKLGPDKDIWLSEKYPQLTQLKEYVDSFRLAFQDVALMKIWITDAKSSEVPMIRSFAAGLERDIDAVLNAVRFSASNAFLEGNVNRLKMIKRTMFGRAGLDLLKVKVVGQVSFG